MKKLTLIIGFLSILLISSGAQSIKKTIDDVPKHIKERKAFKRAEWYNKQRAFPYDTIPITKYRNILNQEIKKLRSNNLKDNSDLSWSCLGPAGVNFDILEWGVVSGRVRAIAVHPTNPLIAYIGAANGGLWKTIDGGGNWQDIGHNLSSLSFGAIAIDPNDPETVYAGSGEFSLLGNFYLYPGNGLYKTTDGGQNWNLIFDDFGSPTNFSDLIISPYNSNIIIASLGGGFVYTGMQESSEGIWISMDGGNSWDKCLDEFDVSDLAFHPSDPDIVYAAIGGYMSPVLGFYISNDLGETWTQSNTGLMLPILGGRMQFDISQSEPNIIYNVIYEFTYNPEAGPTRAYKSVNGGESWEQISGMTNLGGNYGGGWRDQGWYDLCIAVDPEDPNHVLVGNIELHRTIDGSTFTPVRPYGTTGFGSLAHTDYHKLVFAPSNPDLLYIGCDGGIYLSIDKGYSASHQNAGLATMQLYRVASHPTNPQILLGGMQDNSTAMTYDGGLTWDVVTCCDGMDCTFGLNPDTIYTSYQEGNFYRSINGGASFDYIFNANGAWITPLLKHPTDPNIIYIANKKILKSTNAGNTFQIISGSSNVAPSFINTIAQSQVDPNHMIFGTGMDHPFFDTAFIVKVSTDEGVSWTDVTQNIPGEKRWIARVLTDPADVNTMYVLRTGFSEANKLYKTDDLGTSWTNISGDLPDLPCTDVFIDPENTQHIYVANDIGVYHSANGGETWSYASEGIPYVPVIDFDYVKIGTTRYLRVGTHGRSIFETTLPNYCLPEGITFTTQEEIDNFQSNYPSCTEIEGDVIIGSEESDITNLVALNVLSNIQGELVIGVKPGTGGTVGGPNPYLTSLLGLNNLQSVGSNISIKSNDLIQDLAGLEELNLCGGIVWISDNELLQELTGLTNLEYANGIMVGANDSLTSISGLESLDSLSGYFEINFNNSLVSLSGMENLVFVEGFAIENNASLLSLAGLSNIARINDDLRIENNEVLPNLLGLESLQTIGGTLSIGNNYSGEGNPSLKDLTGLNNLDSIGQSLNISFNDSINSLDGIENLDFISGIINIRNNNALESIAGLVNVNATTISELNIYQNNSLSTCEIENFCEYLISPNANVTIFDNAPGCNSPEEVEEACFTDVDEIEVKEAFFISPNPFSDFISIRCMISDIACLPDRQGFLSFDIIDPTGTTVKSFAIQNSNLGNRELEIDLSNIPAGVYFCVLKSNIGIQTIKIIKL